MPLANFFDKAALAAAQVLQGVKPDSLGSILERYVVGLGFDSSGRTLEGRIILDLSINLLVRLYPRIRLMPQNVGGDSIANELASLARRINPNVELLDREPPTAVLTVGGKQVESSVPTIFMGSDRWVARMSTSERLTTGDSGIPFGAAAAACLGNANLFRLLFRDYLTHATPDNFVCLSLFECKLNSEYNPQTRLAVTLTPTWLVGVGAIGNAAVWTLARTHGLTGDLNLIDQEPVELSNLQRYVLAGQSDTDSPKVALAERELGNTQINAIPHHKRWGQYLRDEQIWQLPCVAVAVDSAEDRQAVQASVPKFVINSWTQPNDLGVSRHAFVGKNACLCCLYLPDEKSMNRDQIIAEAIGVPEAVKEIRTLLYKGSAIGAELLQRAAMATGVAFEALAEFQHQSIETFYTRAVCGGLILGLGGSLNPTRVAVPLAFQSAMAGVLLASDLVVHNGDLRQNPIEPITRFNLLRPLPQKLNELARKHYSGKCICQDADFIQSYKDKYQ